MSSDMTAATEGARDLSDESITALITRIEESHRPNVELGKPLMLAMARELLLRRKECLAARRCFDYDSRLEDESYTEFHEAYLYARSCTAAAAVKATDDGGGTT